MDGPLLPPWPSLPFSVQGCHSARFQFNQSTSGQNEALSSDKFTQNISTGPVGDSNDDAIVLCVIFIKARSHISYDHLNNHLR